MNAVPDALKRILEAKRAHVAAMKVARPLAALQAAAEALPPTRGFARALQSAAESGIGLIAECKRASPSAGAIQAEADPARIAAAYAAGGASCLSVLTDRPFFAGRDEDIQAARAAAPLPILRKDFMIDIWQVWEARALGADAILIILAAVDDTLAADLEATALGLGLDVLVETHDEAEMARALRLRSPLVGVNARSLRTLEVDLATPERLRRLIPADRLAIAESGIKTPEDVERLLAAGYRAFLIGEALMRAGRPAESVAAIKALGTKS